MYFEKLHKRVCYALAIVSVLPPILGLPDTLRLMWLSLVALGIGLSWFAEPPRWPFLILQKAWSVATVAMLGYLVVEFLHGGSLIYLGVEFLLWLLVVKLFSRRTARDFMHVCVLSFLLLLGSTAVNDGVSYAVFFVAYGVLSVWMMVMVHLRSEAEGVLVDNELAALGQAQREARHNLMARLAQSRDIITLGFLFRSARISVGMLVATGLFFALFPRIGFGVGGGRFGAAKKTGFSEDIDIRQGAQMQTDRQIVMRVKPSEKRNIFGWSSHGRLRLRGAIFDRYSKGRWERDKLALATYMLPQRGDLFVTGRIFQNEFPDPRAMNHGLLNVMRQDIYLEAIDSNILFTPERTVALDVARDSLDRPAFDVRVSGGGELRMMRGNDAAVLYGAYFRMDAPKPEMMRSAAELSHPDFEKYRALPSGLSGRIRELAERITKGKTTHYDKTLAVEAYLRKQMRYSLSPGAVPPSKDPVEYFLFETRVGYCEHYASSLTLLLRSIGIYARTVNGFMGGEWNPYGQYWVVRQSNAHAWTEVFFPHIGWVSFDATPIQIGAAEKSNPLLEKAAMVLDSLRQKWQAYVIGYDLKKQVSLAKKATESFKQIGARKSGRGFTVSSIERRVAVMFALVGILAVYVYRRRRRATGPLRSGGSKRLNRATELYQKALTAPSMRFVKRELSQTPKAFAQGLAEKAHPQAAPFIEITEQYYLARYHAQDNVGQHAEQMLREKVTVFVNENQAPNNK